MCFSAQASFGASAVLALIGALTLNRVLQKKQYEKIILATIPLLFALQQLCEGFVWVGLADPTEPTYTGYMIFGFLFFAFFVWPALLPYSLIVLETNVLKKNLLYLTWGIGITISTGLAWLSYYYGVTSEISCSHIAYAINIPIRHTQWAMICYFIATITPFFISSKKRAWIIGLLSVGSILGTLWIYTAYFTSVWCFFAALLSIAIYFFI